MFVVGSSPPVSVVLEESATQHEVCLVFSSKR